MYVSDDRWTCPQLDCGKTFVFHLRGESLVIERVATQIRHAKHHREVRRAEREERLARDCVA